MIRLKDILSEEVVEDIDFLDFAGTRLKGAEKITNTTQEAGGLSLLTYKHYKVKLPYYKKASAGKLDKVPASNNCLNADVAVLDKPPII